MPALHGMEPMEESDRWIALPVEGARLQSCFIESSGKDGEVTLKVDGHVPVWFGMGRNVVFSSMNGVTQHLLAVDDNWVSLLIEPAGTPVRIVEAKIKWWLDESLEELLAEAREQWDLRENRNEWKLYVCCDVRLGFEPEGDDSGA